jgi:hypothetical protein
MTKLLLSLTLITVLGTLSGCSVKAPQYNPELGGFVPHGKKLTQVSETGRGRSE